MHRDVPLVSIGMPVFNGEDYVEAALDSILTQTFTNFELIISDNASTDRTEEICNDFADSDDRIRYYRQEKNLGAAANFNRVFELSSGKYFKWAAHDALQSLDDAELALSNDLSFVDETLNAFNWFLDQATE